MSPDYNKKTVADLTEILKSRSLPHSGKKADLIARLQESDKASSTKPAAEAVAATEKPSKEAAATEEVIDWEDDGGDEAAAKPTSKAGAAIMAAGGKGAVANPTAVPNQKVDVDPSTTDDLTVAAEGGEPTTATATETKGRDAVEEKAKDDEKKDAPAVDFSIGLSTTDVDSEMAKRKARAEKFGIVAEDTADKDAQKALERAKRFGTRADADTGVKGLDQALPERSRKRARGEDGESGGRGGKRRDFRGRGRGGRRQGGGGGGDRIQEDGNTGGSGPKTAFSNDKDKLAAEARKKRFAAAM